MEQVLVIVDPALGVSQGHHAGFAEMVAESYPEAIRLKYICHRALDKSAEQRLDCAGIAVSKVFSQDFYQYYQKTADRVEINRYILTLAKEYSAVFRQLIATEEPHLLLYHTLNWEHANALSLALQTTAGRNEKLEHRVLLMFNPGIDHQGRVRNGKLGLNFRVALKKLLPLANVKSFTSCSEYANAYAQLLDLNAPLAIHPNLFGTAVSKAKPSSQAPSADKQARVKQTTLANDRILLYLGDAKADKGFSRLPERIRRLQSLCGSDARFVVQYCRPPNWQSSVLQPIAEEIEALARVDGRIELHHEFWSQRVLHDQLQKTAFMVLDYDAIAYADKTSGLLWLAAHYDLPIVTTLNTWAMREAKRFGLAVTHWDAADTLEALQQRLRAAQQQQPEQDYTQQIAQPFWDWIQTTTAVIKRTNDAS